MRSIIIGLIGALPFIASPVLAADTDVLVNSGSPAALRLSAELVRAAVA